MKNSYDVIIIGAGHNGLVCANQLATKGQKVLVLEANRTVGGMSSNHEFAPDYHVSSCAHLLYGLHKDAYKLFGKNDDEIHFASKNIATLVINQNKEYVRYISNADAEIIQHTSLSNSDIQNWHDFHQQMKKFSNIFYDLANQIPPTLKNSSLSDYKTLIQAGLKIKKLNRTEMRQFLRIVGMNVYDLAQESFQSDLLKSAICYEATLGTRLGPRAPNTVFNLLNRYAISKQHDSGLCVPKGGMGGLTKALCNQAMKHGVDVSISSRVVKIDVIENQAKSVQLSNGDVFNAQTIISNADLASTMLDFVGPQNLDTNVVRRIMHIPTTGSTAKMHLAIDHLPESITGNMNDFTSRIIYAPDAEYIERASNAIKYNEYSQSPVFEILFPTTTDNTLAPKDKHIVSVVIPYVPHIHKNTWEKERERFEDHILETIETIFPGIRVSLEHIETLTPSDIEQKFNVKGGHWHHCEIGLERFLMLRPTPGFSQYKTPVNGLFLCGADCHPGGDVTGAAGLNAAKAVLKRKTS